MTRITTIRKLAAVTLALTGMFSMGAHAQGTKYKVFLNLSYSGNSWQDLAANGIKALATTAPYDKSVEFKTIISGTDVQRQISDIQSMVSAGANAIILYPLSPTALNRAIRAACQKGVVVMAYDSTVTEPCAYNVTSLSARYGSNIAQWIVNQLGGKGEVVINHGVAGTANTVINDELAMKVFKQYPGIKIVSEFYGNWNDATSQQEMAKALAAHPNVDAVWTVDGTYGTLQAVMQNRPNRLVVIAGQSNNGFRLQIADKALQAKGLKGLSTSSGPSIGGYAFKLMMEIVTKQKTLTGHTVEFPLPWVPAAEVKLCTGDKLENGCNTFPAGKVSPLFLNTAMNDQLLPELSLTAVQSGKATAGVKIQALPAVKYAANLPGVTCTDCKAAADAWKPNLVTPIAVK